MKKLLALLCLVTAGYCANWNGAEWHTLDVEIPFSIRGLQGLNCSGDTVYLMPYGTDNRAELIKWSPNGEVERLSLPFELFADYGFNHADTAKRFPGVLQGPTLWRMGETGWDSTRIGSDVWWPQFFATGHDGALHYLINDSMTQGVIYRRSGGEQAELDTVIAPCISMRFVGHWIGTHADATTCVIEESYPSGEDHWIPCIKTVRFSPDGIVSATHSWQSLNRRYLQGIDGRWLVARDFGNDLLIADIFLGESIVLSGQIASNDNTFRLAQNPLDSMFEIAQLPRAGSVVCELFRETSNPDPWQHSRTIVSPGQIHSLHYLIDRNGYGHLFAVDSSGIYRYGPNVEANGAAPRAALPDELALNVSPNPGNAEFRLSYSLLTNSDVSLRVFDVTGREVATLVDAARVAGEHVMSWDASALASGVYFAVLRSGGNATVRKMVLMR
jgi:hypothetical protein